MPFLIIKEITSWNKHLQHFRRIIPMHNLTSQYPVSNTFVNFPADRRVKQKSPWGDELFWVEVIIKVSMVEKIDF